jgi:ribosome assembly protein RRB1
MSGKKRGGSMPDDLEEDIPVEELEYEDPYEDEYEAEIEWDEDGANQELDEDDADAANDDDVAADDDAGDDEVAKYDELDENEVKNPNSIRIVPGNAVAAAAAADVESSKAPVSRDVWLRSKHGLDEENETLTYDATAYDMLHAMRLDWPCLSIAVLRDALGMARKRFPHTMYLAAGTQADEAGNNVIVLLKLSDLRKTKHDDDDDDDGGFDVTDIDETGGGRGNDGGGGDDDDDDDDDDDSNDTAHITWKAIAHDGSVNRLKAMPHHNNILASWSEKAVVSIWDAQSHISALDDASVRAPFKLAPLANFKEHTAEGFALDWSAQVEGRLLSGDNDKLIRMWEMQNGAGWAGGAAPFVGHAGSVEDVQWSPVEANVFASCSSDRTIKVWDTRASNASMLSIDAHNTDVNVIAWNALMTYLIVSGADDGSFSIWDFRRAGAGAAASFRWHTQPITSVEWSPDEDSVLAVACSEQISIWDLSLERDVDAQAALAAAQAVPTAGDDKPSLPANLDDVDADVPPQLLFVHQGQQEIREVHWHAQIPGSLVSTASDGLNVWKASNV